MIVPVFKLAVMAPVVYSIEGKARPALLPPIKQKGELFSARMEIDLANRYISINRSDSVSLFAQN